MLNPADNNFKIITCHRQYSPADINGPNFGGTYKKYKDSAILLRLSSVLCIINPLKLNSDLSQTSHYNIKGLSVSEN